MSKKRHSRRTPLLTARNLKNSDGQTDLGGADGALLNKEITINTFVEDLLQVIQSEELTEVVLVGHSFGGVPISGVADRIPDRIARLVYLDALVLESGKHAFSNFPPAEAEARIKAAEKATNGLAVPVPEPLPGVWGLGRQGDPDYDWVHRRLSPHPLRTYITDRSLLARRLATTYLGPTCTPRNRSIQCLRTRDGLCVRGKAGNGSTSPPHTTL